MHACVFIVARSFDRPHVVEYVAQGLQWFRHAIVDELGWVVVIRTRRLAMDNEYPSARVVVSLYDRALDELSTSRFMTCFALPALSTSVRDSSSKKHSESFDPTQDRLQRWCMDSAQKLTKSTESLASIGRV